MARRTVFYNFHSQSVVIAIGNNGNDLLIIPACFALSPKAISTARPKARSALANADLQAFGIHIGNRKDLFAVKISNHRWN